jgi:serine/threonine-protein kinase
MFAAGTQIGKYTLRRKLGQGGFGSVFAGYDESLEREVALKILNAEHKASDDVMRRFLQEARLAARIGHPGITTVFECAQISNTGTITDGIAYIAMELLDGESLAHRLHRSGRMTTATAMEIARQIASALEAAHKAGIVHRDLKPDNIFLVKDPAVPGGERVKVLDFGIAKLHHTQSSSVHTQTNEVFGTPRYMSPEQCRSATQIDQRSDIYTLGCILFELLTGRPPFVGQTGELFAQHLMVEAPSVLQFVRDTPYHVADLVKRMLAKSEAERPQTMADVQRELEAGGAIAIGVPAPLPPGISGAMQPQNDSTLKAAAGVSVITRTERSSKIAIAAMAGAVAIALAIALVFWLRGSGNEEKRPTPPVAAAATKPQVTSIEVPEVDESKPAAKSGETKPVDTKAVDTVEPQVIGGESSSRADSNRDSRADSNRDSRADSKRDRKHGDSQVGTSMSDGPSSEASKSDGSKSGAPKADAPKPDASKPDARKADARKADARKADAPKPDASKPDAPRVDAKSDKAAANKRTVNPFGAGDAPSTGTLVLRSTPACEILVDGKAIAASTPQDLKLAPGKHRITLVHDEYDIKDSFSVEVKAGESVRVARNHQDKIDAKKRNKTINPFGGGQ